MNRYHRFGDPWPSVATAMLLLFLYLAVKALP